ncbi:MAG: hypothetical protein AB7V42_03640 [Thermoleophilia bacterium]
MSTGDPGAPPPGAEEMMAALAERLARTPVRDVLLQTMATFVDMASIRLGFGPPREEDPRDLTQARQAIETLRALVSVAERELGVAQVRPFREPLAQLQMAYAQIVEGAGAPAGEAPAGHEDPSPPADAPPRRPPDDPASRLWVPPGSRG